MTWLSDEILKRVQDGRRVKDGKMLLLHIRHRNFNQLFTIIFRLNGRRTAEAAFFTFMFHAYYFRVFNPYSNRLHHALADRSSITRNDLIHMLAPQTIRTMVGPAIAFYVLPAMLAGKIFENQFGMPWHMI